MGSESEIRFNGVSTYTCGICMDEKIKEEIFTPTDSSSCTSTTTSDHGSFCRDCMSKHVAAKIGETGGASVRCPEPRCSAALEPRSCGALAASLPDELIVRWEAAACETLVRATQRDCCPLAGCGGQLRYGGNGPEAEWAAECTRCWRLVCAACRELWHPAATCQARRRRRKVRKESVGAENGGGGGGGGRAEDVKYLDRKFKGLVKSKKWKRCPDCKIYVEKQFGCEHIKCRCRVEFCYMCGKKWNSGHDCPFRFIKRQIMRIRAVFKELSYLCTCRSHNSYYG